jgi:hypothetical protein
LKQAAAVTLLRNWMEVSVLYMNYITHSHEQPLGDIEHIWWRFEFQDAVGNLPHIHALIWLKEGSEVKDTTLDRIRGSIMDMIRSEEIDLLVAEGLLANVNEIVEVKELASRILIHVCTSRCKRRVGIENEALKCRATNNALESPNRFDHAERTITVDHSKQAFDILQEVGLFEFNPITEELVPTVASMNASIHYPPAEEWEGIVSPCNGKLFAMTRSAQNLKIVTGYLASRYLAKYLALVDENNRVYIGSMSQERNATKLETQILHSMKVTGSAILEVRKDGIRRDTHHPKGRAISLMEIICVLLRYPQVYTNITFLHASTLPLEERPGIERDPPLHDLQREGRIDPHDPVERPEDLNPGHVLPTWSIRNSELIQKLPHWRTLSAQETLTLQDQILCPISTDSMVLPSENPDQRPIRLFEDFAKTATNDTAQSS